MALTPKQAMEVVRSQEDTNRRQLDFLRFNVYQGQLREEIMVKIEKEFQLKKTIENLKHRIVPINITQKITNKLAQVYNEPPLRMPKGRDAGDQELIDLYSESFRIDQQGKYANRYFELLKHFAWKPYLDRDGIPRLRTLPSHTYTPVSDDPVEPDRETGFIEHIRMHRDPKLSRHNYWTDEEFVIMNGEGTVLVDEMRARNLTGENPFGKIPIIYEAEGDDGRLIPISDDDLISMQFVICSLLTDLTYASKYQAWAIIALTGIARGKKVEFNPDAVLNLPEGADIKAIKPEIDIDKMLNQVEMLISLLLTTKNLSVGDISGKLNAPNAASGVAKMIDRAETTEDRIDQEQTFITAEKRLWDLWANHLLPVYNESDELDPEYVGRFTDDFELSIIFPDQKPKISDLERLELAEKKLDMGLTTKMRVFKEFYPDLNEEELQALMAEIEEEGMAALDRARERIENGNVQRPGIVPSGNEEGSSGQSGDSGSSGSGSEADQGSDG